MNVTEIDKVSKELDDMHQDILKIIEDLHFAKEDVSDVVHYLSGVSCKYIVSKEEAMRINANVEDKMKYSNLCLRKTADKMLEIKNRMSKKLEEYDLDLE